MSTVRKSLFWSFAERYLGQIVTLISSMVLARMLTPEQIGIFSLCAAITAIATIFRDFGVSEYIIQEKELTKNKLKGAYALAFLMAWSMALVLFLSKDFIAGFYDEQGVSEIITVLCLNFVILPFGSPGFAILNREMAFSKIFAIQLPSNVIQAIVAVTLAYLGFSYMSLAWASFTNVFCQMLLIAYFRPKESFLFPSFKEMKHIWRFGMSFSASRTIDVLSNNSHELVISHSFGFAKLGLFSRAQGLMNLFWVNVTSAVARVAAPSFATSFHKSPQNLLNDYCRTLTYITVIAWPFFIFAALEAETIIYILFGEQWLLAAPIVTVLVYSQIISILVTLAPNVLVAMGEVNKRFKISMVTAPIHLVGLVVASYFELIWVAWAFVCTSTIRFLLYNFYLIKLIKFSYKQLFDNIRSSLLITAISISAVLFTTKLLEGFWESNVASFIFNCLVISIVWLASIFIVGHPISQEIKTLIHWLLRKQGKGN